MKSHLLAMWMIFCCAFWVGCDSEEGPPAPGGTDTLPTLGADQSSDESIEQAADQMLQDAGDEVKQIADKVSDTSDEIISQANALADEAESVVSSLNAETGSVPALDVSGQLFPSVLIKCR